MKKCTTQSRKQTPNIYPADHTVAGAPAKSGFTETADDENLAELVWKHFSEEITQALQQTQQDLAPVKDRSIRAKSQKR
jgi:hypothetical protein